MINKFKRYNININIIYNMSKQNFITLKKNKLYYELYSILEKEKLFMNNFEQKDTIKDKLDKLLDSMNIMELSEKFNNGQELLEEILIKIGQNTDSVDGGSLILNGYKNHMYQMIYLEEKNFFDKSKNADHELLNEYCTLSNIDIKPIYNDAAIIKISYDDGVMKNDIIKKEDIINIFLSNYYHTGILVDTNGNLQEIEFTEDGPNFVIGNNFKLIDSINILGFTFMPYLEIGSKLNEIATKLMGKEIKGRLFLTLVCPNSYKKLWSIDKETLEKIVYLLDDDSNFKKFESDREDINFNPYYNLKK